jgi:hypothetical protein
MPRPTRLVPLSLAAAAALFSAAPASAGVVEFETPAHVPTEVVFTDETGEANSLTITQSAGELVVHDSSAPITVRSGCRQGGPNEAVCPRALSVRLELGSGDDTSLFKGVTGYATVRGGPGDDLIRGTGEADNLHAGGGQDRLFGFGGNDRLKDDDVRAAEPAGTGPDMLVGGAGNDSLDYTDRGRSQRVVIDLARRRGAGDTIRNVETVRTGPADDTIAGDGDANYLYGGGGRDTLIGRGGADEMTIGGGIARGGGGDDYIYVNDDRRSNRISCGAGHDHVASYPADFLGRDCEHAQAGGVTVGIEGMRGTKGPVRKHGVLRFFVSCTAGQNCAGQLLLLRSNGSVASAARYTVVNDRGYVEFRVRRADRRRIARGHTFTFASPRAGAPGFRMSLRSRGRRPLSGAHG